MLLDAIITYVLHKLQEGQASNIQKTETKAYHANLIKNHDTNLQKTERKLRSQQANMEKAGISSKSKLKMLRCKMKLRGVGRVNG